jgi:hypothetical protein
VGMCTRGRPSPPKRPRSLGSSGTLDLPTVDLGGRGLSHQSIMYYNHMQYAADLRAVVRGRIGAGGVASASGSARRAARPAARRAAAGCAALGWRRAAGRGTDSAPRGALGGVACLGRWLSTTR